MIGLEQPIPDNEIWRNQDASWRAMLLMQPPLIDIAIMDWEGHGFEAHNDRGITMGDVVDAVLGKSDDEERKVVDLLTVLAL